MQKVSVRSQYCNACQKQTKHERHITRLGCGDLILVLFTSGIWMLVRWLFLPKYHCSVCGLAAKKLVRE